MSLLHRWRFVSDPRAYTAWLREAHGDVVTVNVFGKAWVLVLTAEGARQVLSADPAGYDAFWKEAFTGVTGPASLWVLGGNKHRRERQLLSPAFHARNFRGYGETIRQVSRLHLGSWQPGQTIRAMDTATAISRDVITRLVFGVEDGKFVQEGHQVLSSLLRLSHPLIEFFPGLHRRWFPLWRRYARAKADFADWVNRYLAERRGRVGESHDVLGSMLAARYDDGSRMQDEAIRDELLTILLAGYSTTAKALSWALYELGRHPALLAKLRAEVESLGPEADPGLIVTLPYLGAVCNETMRLHTILAEVARVTTVPVELFGQTIPPENSLIISVMAIHHDPELYPEPDRFIPDRFLQRTYSPTEFLPFGGGHRRCLGAGLAEYTMRIALAEIVTRWEFEPAALDRDVRVDVAMGPKYGVRLRLKARRQPGQVIEDLAIAGEAEHA